MSSNFFQKLASKLCLMQGGRKARIGEFREALKDLVKVEAEHKVGGVSDQSPLEYLNERADELAEKLQAKKDKAEAKAAAKAEKYAEKEKASDAV